MFDKKIVSAANIDSNVNQNRKKDWQFFATEFAVGCVFEFISY